MMINLFSLEILIGLAVGLIIGWFLKNLFSKKENLGDLADNLKALESKLDGYHTANTSERGSLKTILEDIKKGEADVVKSAVVNKTGTQLGLIAQEVEAILESAVSTTSGGVKTLQTEGLFWHMLNAIKELSAKVTALEAG